MNEKLKANFTSACEIQYYGYTFILVACDNRQGTSFISSKEFDSLSVSEQEIILSKINKIKYHIFSEKEVSLEFLLKNYPNEIFHILSPSDEIGTLRDSKGEIIGSF